MKWFYNLKISTKLLLNMGLAITVALVLSIMSFYQMKNLGNLQNLGYSRNADAIAASEASSVGLLLGKVITGAEINRDLSQSAKEWADAKEKGVKRLKAVFDRAETDEEKGMKNEAETALNEIISIYENKILPLLNSTKGMTDEIQALDSQIDEKVDKINEAAGKFSSYQIAEADKADKEFDSVTRKAIVSNIVISLTIILLLIILSLFVIQSIKKPLVKITEAVDKISKGNLDVNIEIENRDEIGMMAESFGKMVDSLNEVISNINVSAEQVAAGAGQVSSASQALSQGSTEQASSIEEITSSMSEIATQTKQNAVNANQANELAVSARENAAQGNNRMRDMIRAMDEINESSENISKIIKVIDEIAFQTNILALNAAVEAARAGQHGKGFAVVAEEVRNLAARSADAAKETTDMIEGSIKKVEAGTKIANDTADALSSIVDGVAKAAALVADIAIASNEQATGISQINQAISQVAQVVQTNSATAEESASASEELSSQAELLKDSVRRFKLKKVRSSSLSGIDGLSPEVLRMIEGMIEKKKYAHLEHMNSSSKLAAAAKSKISLEDSDFGKY